MPIFSQLRAPLRRAVLAASSLVAVNAVAQEPPTGSTPEPGTTAAQPALRLTWDSDDPACGGDDVSARALRMVTPGVTARPLRATVQLRRQGDHWLVRLETESGDQSGRRILRAESCKEIQDAIALLLAMTMESKGDILPPESPAPAPVPAPLAVPPAEPVAPVILTPPAPEMRDERPAAADGERGVELGWFLRLDGKAADGLKPGLGLGVGVSAGARIGSFDIGVGAAHWPESRKRARNREALIDIERRSLGLHVCWNAGRVGALVLAPCLAPEIVVFHFKSAGLRIAADEDDVDPAPSVTARVDLRYELLGGWLSLLASPGLTWERPQPFDIGLTDGALPAEGPPDSLPRMEIYRTRGLGPRFEIGVDARF